jgi:hypothetical protein
MMVDADDTAFETAAVRWLSRFTGECRGVTLGEAHGPLEALDALPPPDAVAALGALLRRHGISSSAASAPAC